MTFLPGKMIWDVLSTVRVSIFEPRNTRMKNPNDVRFCILGGTVPPMHSQESLNWISACELFSAWARVTQLSDTTDKRKRSNTRLPSESHLSPDDYRCCLILVYTSENVSTTACSVRLIITPANLLLTKSLTITVQPQKNNPCTTTRIKHWIVVWCSGSGVLCGGQNKDGLFCLQPPSVFELIKVLMRMETFVPRAQEVYMIRIVRLDAVFCLTWMRNLCCLFNLLCSWVLILYLNVTCCPL